MTSHQTQELHAIDGFEIQENIANGFFARMRGLLGTKSLAPNTGLMIRTSAVHTFGMQYPIDVIFCKEPSAGVLPLGAMQVVKIVRNLLPNRIAGCLGADMVIEVAAGAAGAVEIGHVIMHTHQNRLTPQTFGPPVYRAFALRG